MVEAFLVFSLGAAAQVRFLSFIFLYYYFSNTVENLTDFDSFIDNRSFHV